MTLVKICGLSEVDHALAAAEAGADFVGMVFADSRRKVTPEKALEIVSAVRKSRNRPQTVGVFAGFAPADVNHIAKNCRLDRAQLSGGETWQYCLQIAGPITRTFHVSPETTPAVLLAAMEEGRGILSRRDVIFLLDARVGSASGGTGTTFDWTVAKTVAARFPVMVAGGLDPDNVAKLIEEAHPWAVDVSSGVETGGKKDPVKIRRFVEAVRRADGATGGA